MSTPQIGDAVWFFITAENARQRHISRLDSSPMHATVVYVTNPTTVSVQVLDHVGHDHTMVLVPFVTDIEHGLPKSMYAIKPNRSHYHVQTDGSATSTQVAGEPTPVAMP